jgi:uroporphyrinogen decarboxylase
VIESLSHREPDRIPIDLGATDNSGINAIAYNRLKRFLGIRTGRTQVYDTIQQIVKVEEDILRYVKGDLLPVLIEPRKWKSSRLQDGTDCELPAKWNPVKLDNGDQVVYDGEGMEVARMPNGGYYFEPFQFPLRSVKSVSEIEGYMEIIENYDWPFYADEDFKDLRRKAKSLYENTDYALVACFFGHVYAAGQLLRGFREFMIDLIARPEIAEAIMSRLVEAYIERFSKYTEAIGEYVQVILINDDLGMQDRLQISPALYRTMVKPHHKKLYRFIKENSDAFLVLHSDGAIRDAIPDLIEIGVDAINPVQLSANGMDSKELKKEFGDKICFWGGGCDTHRVLPFGTPREVEEEVKKRISDLAPNGGFVFTQVHNIQADVPPENIITMFKAARKYGGYPIHITE